MMSSDNKNSKSTTSSSSASQQQQQQQQQRPGAGWSNGDLDPQLFPATRDGKLQLYSSQRRWLHLAHGWSRVGNAAEGTHQYSHRTSVSAQGTNIVEDADAEARSVRSLIAQLCETFYKFGWATGTGGGVSIRVGGPSEGRPWRVFVAPSGIQKEDMIGDDVFELDMDRNVVVPPKTANLRQSACTPLWYVVYRNRPNAKSVIHTHSMYAQLATLLDPTESSKVLRITHLEMLKGVGHHAYDDILEVPVIDNRPSEDLLADQLDAAMQEYPNCNCVLVRRHGLYAWGDSWEQAKTQCESFDYLFQSAVEMKKMGLDPGLVPLHGTYRVQEENDGARAEPMTKKQKTTTDHNGWNAAGNVNNVQDLAANTVPILPRDAKHLLLDIEGCTTAISFVKDTLFPFVLEHLDNYLDSLAPTEYNALAQALAADLTLEQKELPEVNVTDCSSIVRYMVKNDLKLPALKAMQGQMWKSGYEKGDLHGHVYDDVVPMLQWMQTHGVKVYIYSSGSVQAQELLFGHSNHGDLLEFLNGHFDITTSGNKKEAGSYTNICQSLGIAAAEIVFCSDSEAELAAATQAGIGHVIMTIRPGNAPLTAQGKKYPQAFSLLQLCGN